MAGVEQTVPGKESTFGLKTCVSLGHIHLPMSRLGGFSPAVIGDAWSQHGLTDQTKACKTISGTASPLEIRQLAPVIRHGDWSSTQC